MRYLGGKYSIRKHIANLILDYKENVKNNGLFYSLFCGALNVESEVAGAFDHVVCNDKHPYLISMLKAVQNGMTLPDSISKDEYYFIKEHKDEMQELAGFVGFGCAFGGKWFGSYAQCRENRNYCAVAKMSLMNKLSKMPNAEFVCGDYRDITIPDKSIVYCDPPYAGVTGYSGVGKFDSKAFWDYMRKLSERCTVLISETQAPDDFISIWERPKKHTLSQSAPAFDVIERVFVYNG